MPPFLKRHRATTFPPEPRQWERSRPVARGNPGQQATAYGGTQRLAVEPQDLLNQQMLEQNGNRYFLIRAYYICILYIFNVTKVMYVYI